MVLKYFSRPNRKLKEISSMVTFVMKLFFTFSSIFYVLNLPKYHSTQTKKSIISIYRKTKTLGFNSLPIDKILDQSKFKAFADDKINVPKN